MKDNSQNGKPKRHIAGEDFLFLMGLGLFIFYLTLVHPFTPEFLYVNLVFWMAVTILFLSLVPDYLNRKVTQQWLVEHKNSKFEILYDKMNLVAHKNGRFFSSTNFFIVASLFTFVAVLNLLVRGVISEALFGVSYGLFMRAILVSNQTNHQVMIDNKQTQQDVDSGLKTSESTEPKNHII